MCWCSAASVGVNIINYPSFLADKSIFRHWLFHTYLPYCTISSDELFLSNPTFVSYQLFSQCPGTLKSDKTLLCIPFLLLDLSDDFKLYVIYSNRKISILLTECNTESESMVDNISEVIFKRFTLPWFKHFDKGSSI